MSKSDCPSLAERVRVSESEAPLGGKYQESSIVSCGNLSFVIRDSSIIQNVTMNENVVHLGHPVIRHPFPQLIQDIPPSIDIGYMTNLIRFAL
jgi:hypothetical protein